MGVYKEWYSSNKILIWDMFNEYLYVTYHIRAKMLKLCCCKSINSLKFIGHYVYAEFTFLSFCICNYIVLCYVVFC